MPVLTPHGQPVQAVAENLKSMGSVAWDDARNRLVSLVYREIAKGVPVSPETIDRLIEQAGLDLKEGREFIAGVSERDEAGNVLGAVGLSQNENPHKFRVNGVDLTTWCALDAFLIAQVLGQTAQVTSHAPGSGNEVTLEINPSGAEATQSDAVMSFVVLDPDQIDIDSVESVRSVFCCYVHFFPSRREAEAWAADSEQQFAILSVDEALEVSAIAFAGMIEAGKQSAA